MAKKQHTQILSPENYIRQRARTLPLYKCFILEEWEDEGLTEIIISRKHANGNLTFCIYLVDLKCLGIKDTIYQFNVPESEMEEFAEKLNAGIPLVETGYNLVHNIIHAAWEYAEEIGFEPHKDFLRITQYMLEEDSDDIPIIEIHCGGKDGKPLYVRGPLESDMRANQILNHLEKTLGEGNYHYILPLMDEEWDGYDDEEDEYYDEYSENSFEENVQLFLQMKDVFENEKPQGELEGDEQMKRLSALADVLMEEIVDDEAVQEQIEKWRNEILRVPLSDDTATYGEMLGLPAGQSLTDEELANLREIGQSGKTEKYIRKRWGEIPYLDFMEVRKKETNEKRKAKIEKLREKYPHYALLKIESLIQRIGKERLDESEISVENIFDKRNSITSFEFAKLQMLRLSYFLSNKDLAGVESLYFFNLSEIESEDADFIGFLGVLMASRLASLRIYLENKF